MSSASCFVARDSNNTGPDTDIVITLLDGEPQQGARISGHYRFVLVQL